MRLDVTRGDASEALEEADCELSRVQDDPLRVRWLGKVPYSEAHLLQRALHAKPNTRYLLLLEHPPVFTMGVRARAEHVLVDPREAGVGIVHADRGGDVTYHGPGQLVGYVIVPVPPRSGSVPRHVHDIEQVVVDALGDLGVSGVTLRDGYPGVWIASGSGALKKVCAVGVKVAHGRSMHGFALNINTDLEHFRQIVPCGLHGTEVTSLENESMSVSMAEVVDAIVMRAVDKWAPSGIYERQEVSFHRAQVQHRQMKSAQGVPRRSDPDLGKALEVGSPVAQAPPSEIPLGSAKPIWLRARAQMGEGYMNVGRTMRELGLVTVCVEAGCPNIFECWESGTATFMINGDRCTRACGFCLIDTSRPLPIDPAEPSRVADAVARMDLEYAVVTAVARDDLADGGASGFARTIDAIRDRCPHTAVEVLIPDCKGDADALGVIFAARPDVLNHNIETVARLQRTVRPSARYARSLSVLALAKDAGLVAKSGMLLGIGERFDEVVGALADLRAVGVEIVTLGQYLRPTAKHLPVARWWRPEELDELARIGMDMGFAHVQASPFTRSSYHASEAKRAASGQRIPLNTTLAR